MYTKTQIDPVVSFRNVKGESLRGTIVNLQRKSLVMEIYNPYSIVQASEVLTDLTIRVGTKNVYVGNALVMEMVSTGLTAIVSVSLSAEWRELSGHEPVPGAIGAEARAFVRDWEERFCIRPGYQVVVNEMRAYLSDVSRWVEQLDMSDAVQQGGGRLQCDLFSELSTPLMAKTKFYFDALNYEASLVEREQAPAHRSYVQTALHPLLLRAPFVYRTYAKPLGYAGDYQMVNQILDDPRQGPNTYFQMVNAAFLQTAVATAHRNRIDILVDFLTRMADAAGLAGRPFRILNVGCGPAAEIQRFLRNYPNPELLSFQLVDFSEETLEWTREKLTSVMRETGKSIVVDYVHDSVHQLLKRHTDPMQVDLREFDAVYCAGLFDYLSDKVCAKLLTCFTARIRCGGKILITNVHSSNPERAGMEHLLEWYLIYRDENKMNALLPAQSTACNIYVDATGVNVFAEATIV